MSRRRVELNGFDHSRGIIGCGQITPPTLLLSPSQHLRKTILSLPSHQQSTKKSARRRASAFCIIDSPPTSVPHRFFFFFFFFFLPCPCFPLTFTKSAKLISFAFVGPCSASSVLLLLLAAAAAAAAAVAVAAAFPTAPRSTSWL